MGKRTVTRERVLKQINDIFDELEKVPANNGRYRVLFIASTTDETSDTMSFDHGWKSTQDKARVCEELLSLDYLDDY